ncbi:MAG: hypothetical protein NC078_00215 [Ruminococcus sp.]|nr:hypothetical protein [Ruminococcus sp.]
MTPIAKNGNFSANASVTVLSEDGKELGMTYPKRAKGLAKKSRAVFVTDSIIRLISCPAQYDNTEDNMMDNINNAPNQTNVNFFYLDPKKWKKHRDVPGTVFERFSMPSPFNEGEMTDILAMGNWNSTWCEITNSVDVLEKNSDYRFVFWLNGGENDQSNEICQLHIIFTDDPVNLPLSDWDNKLCYRLNKGYIKPLKRYNGWELYSIPFKTGDKNFVQMRFVAQYAPMAIMAAEHPDVYKDLPDRPDPFAGERPQRHNIVFEDGWPSDKWYSTENLRKKHGMGGGKSDTDSLSDNVSSDLPEVVAKVIEETLNSEEMAKSIAEHIDMYALADCLAVRGFDSSDAVQAAADRIKEDILKELRG